MARKVRIEEPGSFYHLINRGNYRAWIFETEGARKAFRRCLVEVCQSHGWRLHAWVLMSNHYHLLVETPEGNLVSGMRWLNSTFANRFNRFRNENGHVFQGRYKSILLEPAAVPSVAHYIHLNPVRADVIKPENLEQFVDSSFHHLWHAKRRWSFECFADVLDSLGLIEGTRGWRQRYRTFLQSLSLDAVERKRLGFDKMTWGWVKGSKAFRQAALKDLDNQQVNRVVEQEASEMREASWEHALSDLLTESGRTEADLKSARKGADWKVALAVRLRQQHMISHNWLAEHLHMGKASSVQSWVSRHRNREQKS